MANANASSPRPTWARRTWASARRRLVRWLLRLGLFPSSTRTDSDTMGEWKRLMAEKDDPKPGLVLPDPNVPHAELIRRVRLYAQNGAKALAPLLDGEPVAADGLDEVCSRIYADSGPHDFEGGSIARAIQNAGVDDAPADAYAAIHAAYNSPWTVVDGEVFEYESERRRRVVQ